MVISGPFGRVIIDSLNDFFQSLLTFFLCLSICLPKSLINPSMCTILHIIMLWDAKGGKIFRKID